MSQPHATPPTYTVTWTKAARDQLKDLSRGNKRDADAIWDKVGDLASNPRPPASTALVGQVGSGQRRLRVGNYRVIYELLEHELVVTVLKVGHRSNVYRGR